MFYVQYSSIFILHILYTANLVVLKLNSFFPEQINNNQITHFFCKKDARFRTNLLQTTNILMLHNADES